MISRTDCLELFSIVLEGQTVHLSPPKNQFATDMVNDPDNILSFFATSIKSIEFMGKYNVYLDLQNNFLKNVPRHYCPALITWAY